MDETGQCMGRIEIVAKTFGTASGREIDTNKTASTYVSNCVDGDGNSGREMEKLYKRSSQSPKA